MQVLQTPHEIQATNSIESFAIIFTWIVHSDWESGSKPSCTKKELLQFVHRILHRVETPQAILFNALIYLRRLRERCPNNPARPWCSRRICLVAIMAANKYVVDDAFHNDHWSCVSGLCVKEVNKMERDFLQMLEFNLFVREEDNRKNIQYMKMRLQTSALHARLMAHPQLFRQGNSNTLKHTYKTNVRDEPYQRNKISQCKNLKQRVAVVSTMQN
eukprot:Colp12_sorted_trinity150504_noHs@10141